MNARTLTISTLSLLALGAVCLAQNQPLARTTPAPTGHESAPTSSVNSADNDAQDTADAQPGTSLSTREHSFLKAFAGVWHGAATLHGVEGESASSTITCTSSLTFDRYLTTTFSGEIMGQPFQAVQTWGFNTGTSQYETTWIDNNSTDITFNNGSSNEDGTIFTIDGQVEDPADGSTITQRSVTTLVDNDHFTLELVSVNSQNESTPVMTISFARLSSGNTGQAFLGGQTSGQARSSGNTTVASSATTGTNRATPRGEVQVEVTSAQLDAKRSNTASENEPKN